MINDLKVLHFSCLEDLGHRITINVFRCFGRIPKELQTRPMPYLCRIQSTQQLRRQMKSYLKNHSTTKKSDEVLFEMLYKILVLGNIGNIKTTVKTNFYIMGFKKLNSSVCLRLMGQTSFINTLYKILILQRHIK